MGLLEGAPHVWNGGVVALQGVENKPVGAEPFIQEVILFDNAKFALVDEAGVVAYKGQQILQFPEGGIMFLGAVADLKLSKSSSGVNDDWDGDFGLGTATASNNNSLSSTEQDLIPTTPTPQAVAGLTTAKGISTATEAPKLFDGTASPKAAFLNFLVDDVDQHVGGQFQVETQTVTGTVASDGAGNVAVTITSNLLSGGAKTIQVAVANDDSAATVAGKIRTALNADTDITDNFTVGGSSATVSLTTKVVAANDATLNIAYANNTSSGLTDAPTSANTTTGYAATPCDLIVNGVVKISYVKLGDK